MPFSLIGSDKDVQTPDGRMVKGRQYSWGVAEVENDEHCDFKKLRSLLIRTHMLDLIQTTEEVHYEVSILFILPELFYLLFIHLTVQGIPCTANGDS